MSRVTYRAAIFADRLSVSDMIRGFLWWHLKYRLRLYTERRGGTERKMIDVCVGGDGGTAKNNTHTKICTHTV